MSLEGPRGSGQLFTRTIAGIRCLNEISKLPQKGGGSLHWMRNETLIPHKPVAIPMTIFFPFQMATLVVTLST
jgi:hypothetical protein